MSVIFETAEYSQLGYLQSKSSLDLRPGTWRIPEAPGDLAFPAGLYITAPASLQSWADLTLSGTSDCLQMAEP